MKDKEKQIWQDVANVMCECEDKENFTERYRTKCRGCNLLCVIRHIVFFLNNSDYRKLNEDSVVLSKEEYEKLKDDNKYLREMIDKFRKDYTDIRKETAEKIFKAFESRFSLYYPHGDIPYSVFQGGFEALAKQFGVEIKE